MKKTVLSLILFLVAATCTHVQAQSAMLSDTVKGMANDAARYSNNADASYSTGIATAKSTDNVIIYPNPVHDELNVIFSNIPDIKTLTIVNMIGKVVNVYKLTANSARINVENIPSGVYILRLTDSEGHAVITRKFTHQ